MWYSLAHAADFLGDKCHCFLLFCDLLYIFALFLSGKNKEDYFSKRMPKSVISEDWDTAVQYSCTAGLPMVILLQQIAWNAPWWRLQEHRKCQESWKKSAPCIFYAKIAHFSFVSVDMIDDMTMCTFWQTLSKVLLKDIAMACLRCFLMLLLYELNKSLFCSPWSGLKADKPQTLNQICKIIGQKYTL